MIEDEEYVCLDVCRASKVEKGQLIESQNGERIEEGLVKNSSDSSMII